jgi:hypothetical protein
VGTGADPVADLPASAGCPAGSYHAGEVVTLTAAPASQWQVSGWAGVDAARDALTASLRMPAADHHVTVTYTTLEPAAGQPVYLPLVRS